MRSPLYAQRWLGLCLISMMVTGSALSKSDPDVKLIRVYPKGSTSSVPYDADDPAIWIHPDDPRKSLIIGIDKAVNEGGIYVWDLEGNLLQHIQLNRPNNIDVRYGMQLRRGRTDIAVVNLRKEQRLRVYAIDPNERRLKDITTRDGIHTPELEEPGGVALYHRPKDGAMFVFCSSDDGESAYQLYQYRLEDDGSGRVKGYLVRTFAQNTIRDKVEGMVADDELGYLYASDEEYAVRKFYADPELKDNGQIAEFAVGDGIRGDREGLAIYKCDDKTGYILVSSQKRGTVKVYPREGYGGDPHHHPLLATLLTKDSRKTDGLDVTSVSIPSLYPKGFLVKHDSPGRCFRIYDWRDIAGDHLLPCGEKADKP